MVHIQYNIVNRKGGWCIATNDEVGPPQFRKNGAVRDAVAIGNLLSEFGDEVDVYVEDNEGQLAKLDHDAVSQLGRLKPPAGQLVR